MKNVLWAGALAGACLVLPARAGAEGLLPGGVHAGVNFNFAVTPKGGPQVGPWYLYWPLDPHYQPPAPPAFPYWAPNPAFLPQGVPPPPSLPPPSNGGPATAPAVKPVTYTYWPLEAHFW